jgi:hypothetical protein
MALERMATCPQCRRQLRLTEPELTSKRAFCLTCDAQIDIRPDMLLGDGPESYRALAVPHLQLAPPPAGQLERDAAGRLTIRPTVRQRAELPIWYGVSAVLFTSMGIGFGFSAGMAAVAAGLWCLVLGSGIWVFSSGSFQVWVDPDGLWYRRRILGRWRTGCVPLGSIDRVLAEPLGRRNQARLKIRRRGDEPLLLGPRAPGTPADLAEWMAQQLNRSLELARVGG